MISIQVKNLMHVRNSFLASPGKFHGLITRETADKSNHLARKYKMLKQILGKSKLEVSALGDPWTWDQPGNPSFRAGWGNIDDHETVRIDAKNQGVKLC